MEQNNTLINKNVAVTEVRVGNLVQNDRIGIFKIEIGSLLNILERPKQNKGKYQPIPLTEEWLVRFGFEKPAHSWICGVFHLSEWDDFPLNWCVAMNKNNAIIFLKLKYVHQLQNLYFALTNQELTIKE